jgi:hypothetical protein
MHVYIYAYTFFYFRRSFELKKLFVLEFYFRFHFKEKEEGDCTHGRH